MYVSKTRLTDRPFRAAPLSLPILRSVVLTAGEVVAVGTAAGGAAFLRALASSVSAGSSHSVDWGAGWPAPSSVVVLVTLLVCFALTGHYTRRRSAKSEIQAVAFGVLAGLMADLFLLKLAGRHVADWEPVAFWCLLAPSILVMRMSSRGLLDRLGLWRVRPVMVRQRDELDDKPWDRRIKTSFDQSVALLLLLVLAPLLIIIAALVGLDGGSVLFGHRRVGESGRHFRCLKFRSMVVNSDAVLRELLERDPAARAEWMETQKLRHDPRVTRIGRVLRKTSFDEFPQLFNVLRGEMSLVGPRPIVDAEISRYGDDIAFYYNARPGMTGLWQVSGRSNTSYDARVELDVCYVRNWSLSQDFVILLKTIPAVLAKDGAV